MQLNSYVKRLQEQLATNAELGSEETRQLAKHLTAPLDSTVRLVLLEALSDAADEITLELAPGAVDLRLRGGDPEFVVIPPSVEKDFEGVGRSSDETDHTDEGGTARLNLRLPESLKERIDEAASAEGLSLNGWLIRAATASLDQSRHSALTMRGGDSFTGWVR